MSDDRLHSATSRAIRAQQLMDDELMVEAFANMEAEMIGFWKGTPVRDTDARERIWAQLQNLGKLKAQLQSVITNGKLAQHELNDIATMGERKKRFGII